MLLYIFCTTKHLKNHVTPVFKRERTIFGPSKIPFSSLSISLLCFFLEKLFFFMLPGCHFGFLGNAAVFSSISKLQKLWTSGDGEEERWSCLDLSESHGRLDDGGKLVLISGRSPETSLLFIVFIPLHYWILSCSWHQWC